MRIVPFPKMCSVSVGFCGFSLQPLQRGPWIGLCKSFTENEFGFGRFDPLSYQLPLAITLALISHSDLFAMTSGYRMLNGPKKVNFICCTRNGTCLKLMLKVVLMSRTFLKQHLIFSINQEPGKSSSPCWWFSLYLWMCTVPCPVKKCILALYQVQRRKSDSQIRQ